MRQKHSAVPPNRMAEALGHRLFKQRVVRNAKTYSRKVKHRKRERGGETGSLFLRLSVQ